MGKRSDFERKPRDYYRTFDKRAGNALRPFLKNEVMIVSEPFAGAGDLVNNIAMPNYFWQLSDIEPQGENILEVDAFELTNLGEIVITNCPWTRSIFHKAIEYFTPKVQYCWWLMDGNWQFNLSAHPYLKEFVTDIVSIGRLKWIEETDWDAKDDCVWIRTSIDKSEKFVRFYGRGE